MHSTLTRPAVYPFGHTPSGVGTLPHTACLALPHVRGAGGRCEGAHTCGVGKSQSLCSVLNDRIRPFSAHPPCPPRGTDLHRAPSGGSHRSRSGSASVRLHHTLVKVHGPRGSRCCARCACLSFTASLAPHLSARCSGLLPGPTLSRLASVCQDPGSALFRELLSPCGPTRPWRSHRG